jgi:hypothetical protein
LEANRSVEQLEQERERLERELEHSKGELNSVKQPSAPNRAGRLEGQSPWWRRPALVVGLILVVVVVWLTSLIVALNLLAS